MKTIYFIRHGQSESNAGGIRQGSHGSLSEEGKKQAHAIAKRLKALSPDVLFTSTFPRAKETGEIIAEYTGLSPNAIEDFGERRIPSEMQGRRKDDPDIVRISEQIAKNAHNPDWRYSDEENFSDQKARAKRALTFLESLEDERVVVVTHGQFLRMLCGYILFGEDLMAPAHMHSLNLLRSYNAALTHVEQRPCSGVWCKETHWHVITWNDCAHL